MDKQDLYNQLGGRSIHLLEMSDNPNPIQGGTEVTILSVDDAGTLHVRWDYWRTFRVIWGVTFGINVPIL